MGVQKSLLIALGLGLLLTGTPSVVAAAGSDPTTPSGQPRRFNTNGAEFGSNVELGASGSTPGIILDNSWGASYGSFRAQGANPEGNGTNSWGLLGLLGLLGLSGFRNRESKRKV